MICVFLLILLSVQTLALKPSLKAGLNNQMLATLKDMSINQISKKLRDILLPDFEQDITIATLKVTNISMHINTFGPKQVQLELVPATSEIFIKGIDLSMSGSMNLDIKTFFDTYHCKGFMNATGAGFVAKISLLQNGTRLAVKIGNVQLNLVKDLVNIKITGDVIGSILDAAAKFFKDYFFKNIVNSMAEMLPAILSDAFNEVLGQLPDDVVITPTMAVKFAFTEAPAIMSNYMVAPLLTYVHMKANPNPPVDSPPDMPNLDPTCTKGLQLFFSDFIFRSAVESVYTSGMMTFQKEFKVLGFKVNMNCNADKKPEVKFNGSIAMDLGMACDGDFKWGFIKFKLKFIVGISTILNEWINNSTMRFSVLKLVITTLKIISGKELDAKKLIEMLNMFIEGFRGEINKQLEKKGIPLPVLKKYDLSEIEQKLVGRYIFMCGNLKPRDGVDGGDVQSYYLLDPKEELANQQSL